jgi:hypothetical protein
MKTLALIAAVVLASAGASAQNDDSSPQPPPPPPNEAVPNAAPAARRPAFDARAWVRSQETAMDCEVSARAMRQSNSQQAWEALRACIQFGRFSRGPFTQIALLTAYWDEELRTYADAARVVGQVIANRGGDADDDISRLQKVRMPVFTLGAAMKQPDVYKGRYVIVRARLFDVKMDAKSATAMLAETSFKSAESLRASGDVYVSSYTRSGNASGSTSGSGAYQTDRSGSGRGSYTQSGESGYNSSGSSTSGRAKKFYENVVNATGRQALGRLPEADPFLEPNKEFVFVARFDGVRPGNAPDTAPMAALTILTYYPPGALLLE